MRKHFILCLHGFLQVLGGHLQEGGLHMAQRIGQSGARSHGPIPLMDHLLQFREGGKDGRGAPGQNLQGSFCLVGRIDAEEFHVHLLSHDEEVCQDAADLIHAGPVGFGGGDDGKILSL